MVMEDFRGSQVQVQAKVQSRSLPWHFRVSRYIRRVLTQVLSGGLRREGISTAQGPVVTRAGGDFVGAGAAGGGGGRLGMSGMFSDKYKQS